MDFLLSKFVESWDSPTALDERVHDLKRKLEALNALKEDAESRMRTELHPRKKLKKEIELWLRNVERINGQIQHLGRKIGDSNVVSQGFLKGNVLKKIHEVEELFQQGKSNETLVVDNPEWIGQALSTTTLFGGAAKTCMEEIWAYLMDDEFQKIGVWGMAGVGKTTIMKLIHNKLLKETEKFDIVIWVTVSKEIKGVNSIQNRIARSMNVTLHDDDETIRAGMIYEMLARKGRYVLILDDLWDKLSLEEVGIPEPSNGSKVLITTRLLDVCYYLDCKNVKVPTLSRPDAWGLFLDKVGPEVRNHPDLLPIVESVAEECAGLPLAIVTIASSMKGVHSVHEWRNAFHELNTHGKSVNEMEEKVFQQLQFSYDRLKDEKVKHCFLCCALHPEDCEIETAELINLWIAEGLVEEMESMQMEIDKGYTIPNKLRKSCLVENSALYKDRVKLHDVLRDTALRITSVCPQFLVRAGLQLKEIPNVQEWNEDMEKASLMENWQLQIPPQMPPPKCQKLTTLLLPRCYIQSIPERFFEQMNGLKILDLSDNLIKSLPNSISNLENLTALLLGRCKRLEKLPSFSKLQGLKKLDLEGTNIKDIPHGMEKMVNLKYLDLSRTKIPETAVGIFAKFTSLQYLDMSFSVKIFVRGEEISGLKKLEFFKGRFYDLNELNNYAHALPDKGPRQYRISVGEVRGFFLGKEEKFIELFVCNICRDNTKVLSDVEVFTIVRCMVDLREANAFFSMFIPVPLNIFSSLSRITIVECKNIKKLFSSYWVLQNLQNLVFLHVKNCEDMEEIIGSESGLEKEGTSAFKFILPKLISLELRDLPELKSICGANGVMVCDSIQEIEITNCPKLKRIPLTLPLQDDGQASPPPSLNIISVLSEEWWEMVEWDHPNAKSLLQPYVEYWELPFC
ncbi:hypothetical protein PTKIN_Ptkin14bG0114800 [Pterospermum kingtungense]